MIDRLIRGPWGLALLCLSLAACTATGRFDPRDAGGGDGSVDTGTPPPTCESRVDSDGDGISDETEGMVDTDGDGTPNHLDDDSDGDGISDREEHRDRDLCARPDADGDGVANWLDADSDNEDTVQRRIEAYKAKVTKAAQEATQRH